LELGPPTDARNPSEEEAKQGKTGEKTVGNGGLVLVNGDRTFGQGSQTGDRTRP